MYKCLTFKLVSDGNNDNVEWKDYVINIEYSSHINKHLLEIETHGDL